MEAWRARDRSPLSQASHPLPGLEEGSGMDWAVRVMQAILLPGRGRRQGWPCHQAVLGTAPRVRD